MKIFTACAVRADQAYGLDKRNSTKITLCP
jgi:hypothetical protein